MGMPPTLPPSTHPILARIAKAGGFGFIFMFVLSFTPLHWLPEFFAMSLHSWPVFLLVFVGSSIGGLVGGLIGAWQAGRSLMVETAGWVALLCGFALGAASGIALAGGDA